MSLAEVSLFDTVKKQFLFKVKANIDFYSSLITMQVFGIFFAFAGISYGSTSGWLSVTIHYYSVNAVIAFTVFWGFVTGVTILTKQYTDTDFIFITNRVSSTLSNILFLAATSLLGSVTAMLSKYLLLFASLYIFNEHIVLGDIMSAGDFLFGTAIAFLYVFLSCAVGYLIGTLVQINRIFIILIPALIIGSLILDGIQGRLPFVLKIYEFYFYESSVVLFILKTILTSAFCYIASLVILNRMEVRK
jgi:hypothetical protein